MFLPSLTDTLIHILWCVRCVSQMLHPQGESAMTSPTPILPRTISHTVPRTVASLAAFTVGIAPAARSETIALDFSVPHAKTVSPPPTLPQPPRPKKVPVALRFDIPKASPTEKMAIAEVTIEDVAIEPLPAVVPPPATTPLPVPKPPIAQTAKPLPPPPPEAPKPKPQPPPQVAQIPEAWWQQGSESPLAIALGAAEGTRRYDGSRTPIYYWHTDPGNYADNFGTFSYQHLQPVEKAPVVAAKTADRKRQISANLGLAEIADRRQLARIQKYYEQMRQQAFEKGMNLNQQELIAGLDLANQAPLAALNSMGYLDRLIQMRQLLDDRDEQILEARIWAYWHPKRNTWDAPGLGNTYDRIRHDQKRRLGEIEKALAVVLPEENRPGKDRVANRKDSPKPNAAIAATSEFVDRPQYRAVTPEEAAKRPFPCMLCGF